LSLGIACMELVDRIPLFEVAQNLDRGNVDPIPRPPAACVKWPRSFPSSTARKGSERLAYPFVTQPKEETQRRQRKRRGGGGSGSGEYPLRPPHPRPPARLSRSPRSTSTPAVAPVRRLDSIGRSPLAPNPRSPQVNGGWQGHVAAGGG
jgi:hypothetical protein